jgi:hypothetical protein
LSAILAFPPRRRIPSSSEIPEVPREDKEGFCPRFTGRARANHAASVKAWGDRRPGRELAERSTVSRGIEGSDPGHYSWGAGPRVRPRFHGFANRNRALSPVPCGDGAPRPAAAPVRTPRSAERPRLQYCIFASRRPACLIGALSNLRCRHAALWSGHWRLLTIVLARPSSPRPSEPNSMPADRPISRRSADASRRIQPPFPTSSVEAGPLQLYDELSTAQLVGLA